MKKLIWLTVIAVAFMVFILPGLLALGIKMIPDSDQPGYNSNQRLSIYGLRDITQKFTSPSDNLTAIGTSIRNPNLKNKKDIVLAINDGKLIRTPTINGQNVEDGNFIRFIFDPIPDSKGKTYTFTLSTPTAGPEETIEVFILDKPTGNISEYIYDGKVYPGGPPLVTYYKPGSQWSVVKMVYANLLARLLRPNFQRP